MAVRTGDLDAAELHLQRANELMPSLEHEPGMEASPIMAEYLLARRKPQAAIDLLSRTLTDHAVEPRLTDEMLVWGARAAADLAETARDRNDAKKLDTAKAALDGLVALRTKVPGPPFEQLDAEDMVQPAKQAVYRAETQRLAAQGPTSDAWRNATHKCEAAGMRWEQAIASWRWAQALLAEGASRSAAAAPLRSAYHFAAEEGAALLRGDIEALAASCRIPLDQPIQPAKAETNAAPFNTLTDREHEVLTHLVTGRTYAEIAEALFISEKTVSVHVSNLLRKTGTTSRRDVSALALRTGRTPTALDQG